jgi:integrase
VGAEITRRPRTGSAVEWAAGWERMDRGERRRAAVAAAQAHDRAVLLDLADSWYILYGRGGASASVNTRGTYRTQLGHVLDALAQENLLHPKREAVNEWIRSMHERGVKPSTIHVRRAAGRCLYRALRWAEATADDPFSDVRVAADPVPPWEKRRPYPDGDVRRLLAAARARAEAADEVVVLLGAHAGLRASEMAALRWEDVDPAASELVVRRGKGGKVRTVVLSAATCRALARLAAERGASGPVLPYRGRTTIWRHLAALCAAAGVQARGVHSLRHTAGTRIVGELASLEDAAQQLGHANIQTTRIYAKWNNRRLKDALAGWDE